MRVILAVVVLAALTAALASAAPHRAPGCRPARGLGTVTLRHDAIDLATCTERQASVVTPRPFATVRPAGRGREAIWAGGRRVLTTRLVGTIRGLQSPGPIELLGWSGDRRWIFFAIDPGASASIAADGLILRVVPSAGGPARRLGVMLANTDYLSWCGGRLVFTAGSGREAMSNKRLLVASPPRWRPRPLTAGRGRAWGSLACSGRSMIVQAQPSRVFTGFFTTSWSLWRIGLDGSQTRLTRPPHGYADDSPAVSRDGRTIMFVRSRRGHGRLYALRGGRLLGPLLPLGYSPGFYGHQSWWQAMRWSLARRP